MVGLCRNEVGFERAKSPLSSIPAMYTWGNKLEIYVFIRHSLRGIAIWDVILHGRVERVVFCSY